MCLSTSLISSAGSPFFFFRNRTTKMVPKTFTRDHLPVLLRQSSLGPASSAARARIKHASAAQRVEPGKCGWRASQQFCSCFAPQPVSPFSSLISALRSRAQAVTSTQLSSSGSSPELSGQQRSHFDAFHSLFVVTVTGFGGICAFVSSSFRF